MSTLKSLKFRITDAFKINLEDNFILNLKSSKS